MRIELDDGLMEQDMGEFENRPFEQMIAEQPELVRAMLNDWTDRCPGRGARALIACAAASSTS